MRVIAIILKCLLILTSCISSPKSEKQTSEMSFKEERIIDFVNSFDYTDKSFLTNDSLMSSRMIQLIHFLNDSDSISSAEGLSIFFSRVKDEPKALNIIDSICYLYLGDPNSPYRNDTQYIQILESLLAVHPSDEAIAVRSSEAIRILKLNKEGSFASDFRFISKESKSMSLYEREAPLTLLIFYDPECAHCSDILATLSSDDYINTRINDKEMEVLAIYAEGKRAVWLETKDQMPENWLIGYDESKILDNELYDLPAMPTLYLLDKDKKVLLKDPPLPLLLSTLQSYHLSN